MLQNLFFGRMASDARRRVGLLLMCIWMFGAASVWAQNPAGENSAGNSGAPSIGGVLNADGTINPRMAGSFSAAGFEMKLAANGSPRFVQAGGDDESGRAPQASCSDGWDDRFFETGANGAVYAAVADGAGNVYIGGAFTAVGNVAANRVAKWDGVKWSPLGSGISGFSVAITVFALAVSGTDVYAGGQFSPTLGTPFNSIAKWNGTSWSSLGSGVSSNVRAIAVSGTDVYAGGGFTTAGGVSANRIAKWNGTSWSALGSGVNNGGVESLAVSGTDLYVGGSFTTAGGAAANYVAKWDGTNWSALGSGMSSSGSSTSVSELAVSGTDVYAGGFFTTAGGVAASNVAKWDGTNWSPLGTGTNSQVLTLVVSGTDIYAGGQFTTAGGISASGVAKWNGSSWSALGSGVTSNVYALAVSGTDIYAGGSLANAGGVIVNDIAKWDGAGWSSPGGRGNAPNGAVNAVASDGAGNIYIGGTFTAVGDISASRIAKWNGIKWSALGSGVVVSAGSTGVNALATSGTDVYVGGDIISAGGAAANRIAKWNGASWSTLGSGMNGIVNALAALGSNVYASGSFSTAGGTTANRIAKWDGSNWSALGTNTNVNIITLAVSGTDVYAGGDFTAIGGAAANRIARWDGLSWSALGSGVNNSVNTLAVSGANLYAGGLFTTAGGVTVNRIAKWDAMSWSALGSGVNGSVFALAASGTDIYAGGQFGTAGGVAANRVAKWNGSNWSAVDAGVNGNSVDDLAVSGNSIYADGAFVTAGCRASSRFARYYSQSFAGGGADNDWLTAANWNGGTVPAADSDATIAAADVSVGSADATIRDLRVDEGRTLTIAAGRTLTVTRNFRLLGSITGAGTVVVSNCDPAALVKEAAGGYIRSTLVRCVSSGEGIYNFPVGTANGYSPVQMTNIAGTGSVSILANEGAYSGSASGLPATRLNRWWQIENSGGGVTQTDLIFNYLQSDITGVEASYKAYRISGGTARQVLSSVDTTANTVTAAGVTQFSDWTLAQLAPTAAGTTISGKVLTPKGRGLQNAAVLLTDENGITRRAISRAFGNYHFEEIATGQTYVISVVSKHYQFEPQVITVNGEITEFNLIALP